MANLTFWRHMPRFSAGARFGLAVLVAVMAVGDAVLVPHLLPKPVEVELVIATMPQEMVHSPPLERAFRLKHPAQLSPSGSSWIVDGTEVDDLVHYLDTKAAHAPNHVSVVTNYAVSLGADASYGRALTALNKLAREGMCWGSIVEGDGRVPPDQSIVALYRNQKGELVPCDRSDHMDPLVSGYQ